jgi:hypothetical protein
MGLAGKTCQKQRHKIVKMNEMSCKCYTMELNH